MREIALYILLGMTLITGAFIGGRSSKKCPDCVQIIEDKIKQIDDETKIKIDAIDRLDVDGLDSVWARYNKRYN